MTRNHPGQGRRQETADIVPFQGDSRAARMVADTGLEAQIIGAVLANNGAFVECADLIEEHFSDPVHAELWKTVSGMIASGLAATPATLAVSLGDERLHAFGGREFLSGLAAMGGAIAPALGAAVEKLREYAQWRRYTVLSDEMRSWSVDPAMSADEALSALIRKAQEAMVAGRSTARTKRDVLRETLHEAMEYRDPVSTGIEALDFLLHGGLMPRRMTGISGFYGRGKTILVGTISSNLNVAGVKHMVILLETPPDDVELRDCARRLNMNAAQLLDAGDPDHDRFVANAENYIDQVPENTWYEYVPGATIDQIERMIIQGIYRNGIKGFILDYWQLIRGREKGQTEENHLRECANRLAALCRRHRIWGLITAQCDQHGLLRYCQDGLNIACSLLVRMVREENDSTAYFTTEKSNYSRYADSGSASTPSVAFSMAGPHFANLSAEDMTQLLHDQDDTEFEV